MDDDLNKESSTLDIGSTAQENGGGQIATSQQEQPAIPAQNISAPQGVPQSAPPAQPTYQQPYQQQRQQYQQGPFAGTNSYQPAQNTYQQPQTGYQPRQQYQAYPPQNTYQQNQNPPQYGYQQPNPYAPPQYSSYNRPASTGKGTASLVLGIVSIVFSWTSFLAIISVICGVVGIILGNLARKELPEQSRGTATAGMVCSIVGLVIGVIVFIAAILLVITAVSVYPQFGSDFGASFGV